MNFCKDCKYFGTTPALVQIGTEIRISQNNCYHPSLTKRNYATGRQEPIHWFSARGYTETCLFFVEKRPIRAAIREFFRPILGIK